MVRYTDCLDIPIGTLYYLADARTPNLNCIFYEHGQEIIQSCWDFLCEKIPTINAIQELKLKIVPSVSTYCAIETNKDVDDFHWVNDSEILFGPNPEKVLAAKCLTSNKNYVPMLVWRCPHTKQASLVDRDCWSLIFPNEKKMQSELGYTYVLYSNGRDNLNLNMIKETCKQSLLNSFSNFNGLEKQDLLNVLMKDIDGMTPEEMKKTIYTKMWKGELIQKKIDESFYNPNEVEALLINYNGISSLEKDREGYRCHLISDVNFPYHYVLQNVIKSNLDNAIDIGTPICDARPYLKYESSSSIDSRLYKFLQDYRNYFIVKNRGKVEFFSVNANSYKESESDFDSTVLVNSISENDKDSHTDNSEVNEFHDQYFKEHPIANYIRRGDKVDVIIDWLHRAINGQQTPKEQIAPIKAAMECKPKAVNDTLPFDVFNQEFGLTISKDTWENWTRSYHSRIYTEDELKDYKDELQEIMNQNCNP